MSGIKLEAAELAYLLAVLKATAVAGLDDPALFPEEKEMREAIYPAGLQKLKEHGWLVPAKTPGQVNFNDELVYLIAVIADPDVVVVTNYGPTETERRQCLHYVTADMIVELVATAAQEYTLGIVPDQPTLLDRIGQMIALPPPAPAATGQFSITAQTLAALQQLVAAGQFPQAVNLLREQGPQNGQAEAFLKALRTMNAATLITLAHARRGQFKNQHRTILLREADQAWLVYHPQPEATLLQVEPAQPDTLAKVINRYFEFLKKPG